MVTFELFEKYSFNGATTLSITTLSIMSFSIATLSIITFSTMTHRITFE
jgi:hypothetical protein